MKVSLFSAYCFNSNNKILIWIALSSTTATLIEGKIYLKANNVYLIRILLIFNVNSTLQFEVIVVILKLLQFASSSPWAKFLATITNPENVLLFSSNVKNWKTDSHTNDLIAEYRMINGLLFN